MATFVSFAQVETELTNFLNLPCDFTVCSDIQLGHCPGDTNSQGEEYQFTEFQVYYSDEDVDLEYDSLTLRNCRLEFRNGASLIDNGIEVNIEGDCNAPDQITEIVFIGGGNRFANREEYDEYFNTLSLETVEQNNIKPLKEIYYDMLGKQINIQYASSGIYLKRSFYPNNLVEVTKVRK